MPVAVAAPHPAGLAAAREVVASGGGPVDAAVAAAAALTVTYPHQCSVGGDLVALLRTPDGTTRAVVSAGAAPAALDVAALRAAGPRMPAGGPLTVTVPGVVAGWAALAALAGSLSMSQLLAPARRLADDGVPVSAGLARAAVARTAVIAADPGLAALLLDPDGAPRAAGSLLRQPALAATLAELGADWTSFYRGPLAGRLAAGLAALGSPLGTADLAAHAAEVTEALSARVGTTTWTVAPPPTQGAALLAVLTSGTDRLGAARAAELRRDALLGDPRTSPVDPAGLLAGSVPGAAVAAAAKPRGDTVAVTAVGEDGTAVALVQSVFQSFGAGLLEPATGIVLHNRGSAFSLDPDHPGRVQPGSRPPHTLCPTLGEDDDGTLLALGCQGGRAQAWILSQVAADLLTPGADPVAVLSRPRWVIGARDLGHEQPTVVLEPGTPGSADLAVRAAELGLAVATTAGPHDDAGHVQAARLSPDGRLSAATDPRADGTAGVLEG